MSAKQRKEEKNVTKKRERLRDLGMIKKEI